MSGAKPATAPKPRDARLDLARGLTMLVIFIAHVPGNPWADWIPARMGFSSGAEAFVLCSGLACGLAFGRTYQREGWTAGTIRIAKRVRHLWLVQVLAFIAFAGLMLWLDHALGGDAYRNRYSLGALVEQPAAMLLALASLRYVPAFFDILPLYIVLLAALPLVMLLAKASPRLVMALSFAAWLFVQIAPLHLPSHPLTDAVWYFNPLAWQFLFLIGYGLTAGWFPCPRLTPLRLALALGFVLASFLITFWMVQEAWPLMRDISLAIYPADAITTLHITRLAHVLALGWLFAMLLEPRMGALNARWLAPVIAVGQQALPTFIGGVFLSALGGVVLDQAGAGAAVIVLVNLAGIIALVAIAHLSRAVTSPRPSTPARKEPSYAPR